MKVTILGTANAWGPNPFLKPPAPWPMTGTLSTGTQVEIRKYRTSLLVESSDGHRILVDCGPDFSHQLREFRFGMVDAILLTHPHLDHVGGLDELSLYRGQRNPPLIPAYATEKCWDAIKNNRGLGYVITPLQLVSENHLFHGSGSPTFHIGSVAVTPFPVEHHQSIAPGAVGFAFEETTDGQTKRVLYTGDFWAISNPMDPLFRKPLDVAIIECDRWDGLAGPAAGGGHMSFQYDWCFARKEPAPRHAQRRRCAWLRRPCCVIYRRYGII
jgi:phosphoribosyl 1,2-cyclic phosphodiesterase